MAWYGIAFFVGLMAGASIGVMVAALFAAPKIKELEFEVLRLQAEFEVIHEDREALNES
ncbi:hypothetical protein [Megasphaera vaginalis (ex Srinivasan et al. 2021)]|jgi:hypothetical protein|uniref:Uncharacterized protein n=1 Tax=Megasphaera vaginalis (ex Srinivasan et al. 2021) TaxID=1111454 RepID=U7USR5_9FIRM|nr:hypothetical protein [Megasphaera vaginalis (ex Srinivasan et al. 2021)]ERT62375.1 hypothetical protein HMPREF1250_0242 [Megasphaera vaginalis (ex Srinivasan et al. 2021)]